MGFSLVTRSGEISPPTTKEGLGGAPDKLTATYGCLCFNKTAIHKPIQT